VGSPSESKKPCARRGHRLASLAGAALAAGVAAWPSPCAADVPITEDARTHFAAGVALLQDPKAPRYEEAYREFKAAYAASPSYKILGNLGLCAMKIERDAEAIAAYETYLKEAGGDLSAPERSQAERDLLTLKAGVVTVTVSSSPAGASIVDVRTPIEGGDIRNTYGDARSPLVLGLRRGHHVVTARSPGYLEQQWEFEASGTTLPPHVFHMIRAPGASRAAPTTSRPIPVVAYVSGATTIGLALAGTIVGFAAVQRKNEYNDINDGLHRPAAQDLASTGTTLDVVADSLFGGAVLGAVLTGYFVVSRPTVEHVEATGLVPRVTPAPVVGAGAGVGPGLAATWVY
jgi:hypothetical protein